MSSSESTEALFLGSVDYLEADRIVTLLTRRFGKVAAIARSARRSRRRFGGALSPFLLLNVELRRGRGELAGLSQAHVTRAYARILGDLSRLGAGYAGLELTRELCAAHAPDDAVFATVMAFVEALDGEAVAAEELLLCFAVRLLSLTGFAPDLRRCGLCGRRPGETQAALFDPAAGHLTCRACGGAMHRLSPAVRARLVRAQDGDFVAAAQPPRLSAPHRAAALTAIATFVEHRTGRPLRATSLARSSDH